MSHVELGRYGTRIFQYFWDPEPKNDDVSKLPIWCLGKEYDSQTKSRESAISTKAELHKDLPVPSHRDTSYQVLEKARPASPNGGQEDFPHTPPPVAHGGGGGGGGDEGQGSWPHDFLDDFESRLWFTYRSNFPLIKKSSDPKAATSIPLAVRLRSQLVDSGGFTSDTGWGCMIRSGQSLLANSLVMLRLGRDWRRGSRRDEEGQILRLFADDPNAPFSIHRFVQHGASACGKHPGEWFGPSATARCIQALSSEYTPKELRVYITGDGADVYEDSFLKVARRTEDDTFTPTLILVGIRLGIDRVTPAYWEALKESLKLPQSIGIAGGRPSSSHYFVAVQDDKFFYLDPHQTRVALPFHTNVESYTTEEIDSCHTRRLRRLSIEEMDPSMLLGFLIRDIDDWKQWRKAVTAVQGRGGKPVVRVGDIEPGELPEGGERPGAVDDVETFDDEEDSSEGELVERPSCR